MNEYNNDKDAPVIIRISSDKKRIEWSDLQNLINSASFSNQFFFYNMNIKMERFSVTNRIFNFNG